MRRPRRGEAGFTLLELLIALAIVGALLAIAFGGLRVALAAWRQGEDRAEAHQHVRGVALALARSIGATYPYRASRGDAPDPVVLFEGAPNRIEYVTQQAPFPLSTPIAFTAVVISHEAGAEPGLVVRQRALPNRDPFTDALPVFRDETITSVGFEYMDETGKWSDRWDSSGDNISPRAVRITLEVTQGGRVPVRLPLTVSLRTDTR